MLRVCGPHLEQQRPRDLATSSHLSPGLCPSSPQSWLQKMVCFVCLRLPPLKAPRRYLPSVLKPFRLSGSEVNPSVQNHSDEGSLPQAQTRDRRTKTEARSFLKDSARLGIPPPPSSGAGASPVGPCTKTCQEVTQEHCRPLTARQGSGPPRAAGGRADRRHLTAEAVVSVVSGNQLYFLEPPVPPLLAVLPKVHLVYLSLQSYPLLHASVCR